MPHTFSSDAAPPTRVVDVLRLAKAVSQNHACPKELLSVLDERAECYAGLGTDDCERLRGVCFSALEHAEWHDEFCALVLEELRTSYHPASLGGAARAVCGCDNPPDETAELLVDAIDRIIPEDKRIDPAEYYPSVSNKQAKTVTLELVDAFVAVTGKSQVDTWLVERIRHSAARLRPSLATRVRERLDMLEMVPRRQECCGGSAASVDASASSFEIPADCWSLEVEDQSGNKMALGSALKGKPSFLTFFYTRCMNPMKCSATITKIARLQKLLKDMQISESVNLIAITYDPEYDVARRLHTYGKDRGVSFTEAVRLIRVPQGAQGFFSSLRLLVGYGPSTVNRHGLDAYILDADGKVQHSFVRQVFECHEVLEKLGDLCSAKNKTHFT